MCLIQRLTCAAFCGFAVLCGLGALAAVFGTGGLGVALVYGLGAVLGLVGMGLLDGIDA